MLLFILTNDCVSPHAHISSIALAIHARPAASTFPKTQPAPYKPRAASFRWRNLTLAIGKKYHFRGAILRNCPF